MATVKDLTELLLQQHSGFGPGEIRQIVRCAQDAGLLPKAKQGGRHVMPSITARHCTELLLAMAGMTTPGGRTPRGAHLSAKGFGALANEKIDRTLSFDIEEALLRGAEPVSHIIFSGSRGRTPFAEVFFKPKRSGPERPASFKYSTLSEPTLTCAAVVLMRGDLLEKVRGLLNSGRSALGS